MNLICLYCFDKTVVLLDVQYDDATNTSDGALLGHCTILSDVIKSAASLWAKQGVCVHVFCTPKGMTKKTAERICREITSARDSRHA